MSNKYTLSTVYVNSEINTESEHLQKDSIRLTNNVQNENYEPLKAEVVYKHDGVGPPWLELQFDTKDVNIEVMLGQEGEAEEFVDWLDGQIGEE